MKFIKLILFTFLTFVVFQNCSSSEHPITCTDEFVFYTLTVLEPDETPADSVEIKVINKKNEEPYECGEYLCKEKETGTFIIMHDGMRDKISSQGEPIVVEGTKEGYQFSEEFIFRTGKCHMEKIAGPDTVALSSN